MLVLGLTGALLLPGDIVTAGSAGVGKDSCADYLVERYGWTKFAFSDQLYAEVAEAFDLQPQHVGDTGEELLRDRATKETPTPALALENCNDSGYFVALDRAGILPPGGDIPQSPRWILQTWGTEYRRMQDPDYWVQATAQWLRVQQDVGYPEHRCQYYVNTTVRFENEREWIRSNGGQIWHIRRPTVTAPPDHVSEQLLPVRPGERELWNCGSLDTFHHAIDLLMRTSAPVVKALPIRAYTPTEEDIADAQA